MKRKKNYALMRLIFIDENQAEIRQRLDSPTPESIAIEARILANQFAAIKMITCFDYVEGVKHIFNAQGVYEYTLSEQACKFLKVSE